MGAVGINHTIDLEYMVLHLVSSGLIMNGIGIDTFCVLVGCGLLFAIEFHVSCDKNDIKTFKAILSTEYSIVNYFNM